MIELTDEYREAAKKYKKKFGYGVPLSMIPPTVSTEDLIVNLNQCVETGVDDLLERYYVEDPGDALF